MLAWILDQMFGFKLPPFGCSRYRNGLPLPLWSRVRIGWMLRDRRW